MTDNESLLPQLAQMWTERDPMPAQLVDKVLVALATEDLDEEYELLHLIEVSRELAGARATTAETITISFSGRELSLLLRVAITDRDSRRVDGWVSPPQAMQVTARQVGHDVPADVDPQGRFALPNLKPGLTRIRLLVPGTDELLFATPTFEL